MQKNAEATGWSKKVSWYISVKSISEGAVPLPAVCFKLVSVVQFRAFLRVFKCLKSKLTKV